MNFCLGVFAVIFVSYPWHGVVAGSKVAEAKSKLDLNKLSSEEINMLLDSILEKRNKEKGDSVQTCIDDFEENPKVIIRTRDSLNRGATFIRAPKGVETLDECKMKCCDSLDDEVTCDLAVFQSVDDDPTDDQPKCFLFSCIDESGKYVCVTSVNLNYSIFHRKIGEETQLLKAASSTSGTSSSRPVSTSSSSSPTTTTSTVPTSAVTTTTTQPVQSKPASFTEDNHPVKVPESNHKKECGRLEWQCDDGSCIKVIKVCDKKPDCKDSSDESICDAIFSHTEKHLNKSASSTTTSTTILMPSTSENEDVVQETVKPLVQENPNSDNEFVTERVQAQRSAILPLALGLAVLICILLMVVCRVQIMKRRLRRSGKPLSMEESDYLINGMYL